MAGVDPFLAHMRTALKLAARGRGAVEPNPMVGAVIARGGQVLGLGWHRRFGGPHAEVEAIQSVRDAGHSLHDATLYVTLEPCSHHGKTPPCAEAVIRAGIRRVVVAMQDPNPKVAGRGLRQLRQAGVDVEVGLLEAQARELNAPFIKRHTTALPWVIAKWAQTLDGATATRTGHSKWISSPRSRRIVHQLRARVDIIMVGIGTALADDPTLTARGVPRRRIARRVIIDPRLRLSLNSRLVRTVDQSPLLIVTTEQSLRDEPKQVEALRAAGVDVMAVPALPAAEGQAHVLDLRVLLSHLVQERQVTNVLVEGGAHLLGCLLRQRLVDQALAFVAPRLLGDEEALPAVAGLSPRCIEQGPPLALRRWRRIDDDLLLDYRVRPFDDPAEDG